MLKIGVIDSGLGGLSIVKTCLDMDINGEYIYLYDNKYHPYGGREKEQLTAITFLNIEKLTGIGCDVILLACNTVTSACIEDMRRTFYLPIVGTEPPLRLACLECRSVALLATPYTIKSTRVAKIISDFPNVRIVFPDCSGLASAVEYGYDRKDYLRGMLSRIMAKYSDIEGVAIGCTHYSFLSEQLYDIMPHSKIYQPSHGVAKQLYSKVGGYIGNQPSSLKIITTQDNISESQRGFIASYLLPHKAKI